MSLFNYSEERYRAVRSMLPQIFYEIDRHVAAGEPRDSLEIHLPFAVLYAMQVWNVVSSKPGGPDYLCGLPVYEVRDDGVWFAVCRRWHVRLQDETSDEMHVFRWEQ